MAHGQPFITVTEAARRKGCSRQAINKAILAKRLRALPRQVTKFEWDVDVRSLAKLVINPNMQRAGRPARANGHKGGRPKRHLCSGCLGELTAADRAAGECTQCHRRL